MTLPFGISVGTLIKIAIIAISALFSLVIASFIYRALKKMGKAGENAVKNIDRNHIKKGDMAGERLKLSKLGICYRLGNYELNPSRYAVIRAFVGIITSLVLYLIGAKFFSVLGLPVGYILTEYLFVYMNKRDNEAMFTDIYNTYSNLKIQLSSGIYMGDCLDYTYGIVQNKRYKEALKELVINFSDKTKTSSEAIDIFKNRFSSREIDKLCSMMTAFVQYGISENYINDIMREVQSLLNAESLRTQHAIEQRTNFITFGFFAIVIVFVVITMLGSFNGANLFTV